MSRIRLVTMCCAKGMRGLRFSVLFISIVFLMCSCSEPNSTTKVGCETLGGTWDRFGLLEQDQCDLPTSDAGNVCSDHEDCESACIAENSVAPDTQATGTCFDRTVTLGTCLNYVKDGTTEGVICVD